MVRPGQPTKQELPTLAQNLSTRHSVAGDAQGIFCMRIARLQCQLQYSFAQKLKNVLLLFFLHLYATIQKEVCTAKTFEKTTEECPSLSRL